MFIKVDLYIYNKKKNHSATDLRVCRNTNLNKTSKRSSWLLMQKRKAGGGRRGVEREMSHSEYI